jgi:uncharacterized DUF497 family protein
MEFEWYDAPSGSLSKDEVAEAFEDPFCLRLLPDSPRFEAQNRFLSLGSTSGGKKVFSVYVSTGKVVRIVAARPMTEEETLFYERKAHELL